MENKKNTKPRRRKKARTVDEVKEQFALFLPALMHEIALCYEEFLKQEVPEDAKGFSAHHSACKAALSHIELLTKLARWAESNESDRLPEPTEGEDVAELLAGARAALQEIDVREPL